MQRLILMPASFGGETIKPAGFDLLATMVDESGILDGNGEKLIVYAHYRESNVAIAEFLEKIKGVNPVQAYGDLGSDRNLKNVQRFLDDPLVNVLVANPRSIGIGLNLQSVCRSMLFLELPLTADDFIQAVGRIKREGQTKPCLIRFGVAKGTIQEAIARAIVKKEDIVQKVRPTVDTLRSALFGR
jgi:superfamily II DNA helicase RecQ